MLGELRRGTWSELTAESMRAATLVGLAAIPVGFLWIYLFGTGSGVVLLATGIVVGALYHDRRTPAQNAGARAGLFAPFPELAVQSVTFYVDLWNLSADPLLKAVLAVLVTALLAPVAWILFAFLFVIGPAFLTARVLEQVRPYLPTASGT